MGEKSEGKITIEEVYKLLKSMSLQVNEIKGELSDLKSQLIAQNNEIVSIKQQNISLKQENIRLVRRIDNLERKNRENNLIFYNIPERDAVVPLQEHITSVLKGTLKISIEAQDICNVYRIGKNTKPGISARPVLLKLGSYLKKKDILSNVKSLKGTGIGISEDLTEDERSKRKLIFDHYKAAKLKSYSAKLYNNRVVINGIELKYEDLKDSRSPAEKVELLVSASVLDENFGQKSGTGIRNPLSVETRSRLNSKSSSSSLERQNSKKGTKSDK